MTEIAVHIDAVGARLANGGFVMLTQMALALQRMGYQVGVFDVEDRLTSDKFDWLSLEKVPEIIPYERALEDGERVVTGWMQALMTKDGRLYPELDLERLRVWDGELLRDGADAVREIAWRMPKIAIVNRGLYHHYGELGYRGKIVPIENWIRDDLFVYSSARRSPCLVGYQTDNNVYDVSAKFKANFDFLLCEGTQAQVADKMQCCDFFVSYNRHFDCFQKIGLKGETFNLSAFEAMACGCITLMRWNDAWADTKYLLMYRELDKIIDVIKKFPYLGEDWKEDRRQDQLALIQSRFRFDHERRAAIEEWLA